MKQSTITPQELERLRDHGADVDLIDVRTPVELREVHVAHARNSPLDGLDPEAVIQARDEAKDETLYLICRGGQRGEEACEKFRLAGFTETVNVDGGTLACEQAGLPMSRGKEAVSLKRQVRITAGSIVLLGTILGWLMHPGFYGLSAFVGAGLMFAGITDTCGTGDDAGPDAVEPIRT